MPQLNETAGRGLRRPLGKNRTLRIRCSEETLIRFKRYAAPHRNYEVALCHLLDQIERLELLPHAKL